MSSPVAVYLQPSPSLDDLMDAWEENVKRIGSGTPRFDAFLDLAAYDVRSAAGNIDCPYCRRHMLLEAAEITHVLDRLRAEGNRPHMHGLRERLTTLMASFQIVANVLLGGLRRAGIIS